MKLIKTFDYKDKKVEIYQDDTQFIQLANVVYRVYVNGACVSDEHSIPGPTLDLVEIDVKHLIDNNQDIAT